MDQFQILKQLGSGSFGRVIKVAKKHNKSISSNTAQFYAIKQIKMNELNSKEKDNALNQIRLLASIDSPYIIKYKSAFFQQQKSTLCIVMQYADGGDLQGLIKKKISKSHKFNQNFVWQVAFDILRGLNVLHSNKILHRDIKPANIFFVDGVAKLGDLNVSKVMSGKFAMTQTGTPYYTSPQIWNNKQYDYKCDVWSLGCVMYQLCALHPPFMAKDFPGLSKKITAGYYDPISSLYSKKLSQMIRKCLTIDTTKRPTVQQLLKTDVFSLMQSNEVGQVQLLDTIRCPKVLKLLNEKLPDDQYDMSKKVKTLKVIEQQSNSKISVDNSVKSLKKIGSQHNIRYRPSSRQKYIEQMEKQNKMKMPMQSPQGYVKLPRIPSVKYIPI